MHGGHDEAEQLELAHLAVPVLVGTPLKRAGKRPTEGTALLALDRHLRRQLVLGDGADKSHVLKINFAHLREFLWRKCQLVAGDRSEAAFAEFDSACRRAPLHA